jgi:phytanoyl-CoA hydroxylase
MLNQEQVDQYQQNGYTVVPDFLSPNEVAGLLDAIEQIVLGSTLAEHDKDRLEMEPNQPPDGTYVRRIYEPCSHYPLFNDLSEAGKLLDSAEQLLGSDLVYHYSKINMKPAEIGSVVEWHQDLSYYPLTNRDSLAVLFYLDDTSQENGCLKLLPGRQQGPLLGHAREGYFQGKITEEVDASDAVFAEGAAGTAIFMNSMTPHASTTNQSTRPRRTLILSYRAADAFPIYYGEQTHRVESYVRLVRGSLSSTARFTMSQFPIPQFKRKIASLYELQESSRERETT